MHSKQFQVFKIHQSWKQSIARSRFLVRPSLRLSGLAAEVPVRSSVPWSAVVSQLAAAYIQVDADLWAAKVNYSVEYGSLPPPPYGSSGLQRRNTCHASAI